MRAVNLLPRDDAGDGGKIPQLPVIAGCVGSVLVAAVLIVTSWMGLVAAGIVFAWGQGASWPIALGIACLLNLVAAAALAGFTFKLAKELPFTALLRQLRGRDPEPPQ